MTSVFFRTFIIYILLISIIKLMGKRQVGELEISELVSTLLLSELATMTISTTDIPLLYSAIPIIIILSFEIIVTYLATKSNTVKRIVNTKPSVLICRGVLNRKELERSRISLEELISELRLKDITDIKDVQYAILEQNGQLTAVPNALSKNVTVSDMNIQVQEKGIAHALIIDGHIKEENLRISGRTEEWLIHQIAALNCTIKDIFLFTVNDDGEINLIKNAKE